MSYNLFPSMRAIQLYENMTNTSFLDLENNQDKILHLLYCVLVAHPENDFHITFETACNTFFEKNVNTLVAEFTSEMAFIEQFTLKEDETKDDKSTVSDEKSSPKDPKKMFLSSLIPILVTDCHLDIEYVLDKMSYNDIEMYVSYSVSKKQEAMEEQRFWTFLNILPHINSKKIKEPEDLFEFTWEKDKRKEEAEKKLAIDRKRLIEIGIIKPDENESKE